MTTYVDIFGGSSVQPGDVEYRAVALSASITTVWPQYATTGNQLARIMKVTPSAGSLTVTLPDARLVGNGQDVLFDNPSATTFTVLDSAGNSVATLTSGQVKYFYLSDNSTAAGTWRVTLFGVGSSSPDASQLVGYGLKAISATLNFAPVVTSISIDTVVVSTDRAKVYLWTGGSGTLTLPTTAGSTSDWSIEVRNQGTGTLTIAPVGGVLIDGSASIALVVNESCFIHMGSADWYTVGRGRNSSFNFTRLSKVVDGGTDNLTLTEASNVVQTYTGALLSNQTVNVPAVVQVYYVSNNTTGVYTLTIGCVAGGTSVVVAQTQSAVLFCDGTNVINANTQLAGGVSTVIFGAGTVANPSVAIGTSDDGFYAPATDKIGISLNATASGLWDSTGYHQLGSGTVNVDATSTAGAATVASVGVTAATASATASGGTANVKATATTTATVEAESSAGAANITFDRAAGQTGAYRMQTGGLDRWTFNANNVAEGGANAGSNLEFYAYDDAGASLGTWLTVARATRVPTYTITPMNGCGITRTARGSNTILAYADNGGFFDATAAFTQTLTAAATLGSNWFVWYRNSGVGTVTIDPNGGELIDGATTIAMAIGDTRLIQCDGSAFRTALFAQQSFKTTSLITVSGNTFTVPAGVYAIRAYVFGAGGAGAGLTTASGGGGGGGCTYGTIPTTPGTVFTFGIAGSVVTLKVGATTYLTANSGAASTNATGGVAGAAGSVGGGLNIFSSGASAGGTGGNGSSGAGGGGSSGSPINVFAGATGGASAAGGGGGWGGIGSVTANGGGGGGAGGGAGTYGGGGAGGAAGNNFPGKGTDSSNALTDPLTIICTSCGGLNGTPSGASAGPGGGGGGGFSTTTTATGGAGGMGGGGGSSQSTTAGSVGGPGGFGGGGGGAYLTGSSPTGGAGGVGGGGGGAMGTTGAGTGGAGGSAAVLIFY